MSNKPTINDLRKLYGHESIDGGDEVYEASRHSSEKSVFEVLASRIHMEDIPAHIPPLVSKHFLELLYKE